MRRAIGLMLATITIVACSGSDAEPPPLETAPAITSAPTSDAPPPTTDTTTESADPSVTSTADTTATTTIPSPTTSIDEATILAQAEAAYFEAYEVGRDALRNPDDPENEARIRNHFTAGNLGKTLDNLRLALEGDYVAKENADNPSFAMAYGDVEFVDQSQTEVRLTVCEFYSDQLFEIGNAPNGGDSVVRDDPVTQLFVTRLRLEDNAWKSSSGSPGEQVFDERERCTDAS